MIRDGRKKKGFIIILTLLFLLSVNYPKEALALEPPAMSVTGIRKDVITPNNAILYASCLDYYQDIIKIEMTLCKEYKGEVIGKIEKKIERGLSWIDVKFDIQKEMGIKLQPGTQYYVHYQAIRKNGREPSDYSNGILFVTPNAEVSTIEHNIEEDNAVIKFNVIDCGSDEIIKAGVRVTCFGCIVGIIEKDINQQTDNLSIDFDLKNEGKMSLLSNCNYQYNAYVVTKSLSGWKNEGRVDCYGAFKTLEGTSLTKGINKITKRNVIIRGNLLNPRGKTIEKYGVVIKKGRKVIGRCEKICPASEQNAMRKQLKFNIRKDSKKIKLLKGKKYRYEVYSYVGGEKYTINGRLKVTKNIIKR